MRETLGEAAFSTAMAEGGKLSYGEAMAETREWLGRGRNNFPGGTVTFLLLTILLG